MSAAEDFTVIDHIRTRSASTSPHPSKSNTLFSDFHHLTSAPTLDLDTQIVTALREKHPDLIVTTVPAYNCNLLQFAAAGFATADLDEDTEPILRWRGFAGPSHRGGTGSVIDSIFFARFNYKWANEAFIFYSVLVGTTRLQYILKEPVGDETPRSDSSVVTKLLATIGAWLIKEEPAIYVYDGFWTRSTKLWEEVEKARWEDVILDPKMKKAVTEVASKFFDSKDIYEEYGVPWKRGVIFHGPVGNGKTISLKALMHTLYDRKSPVVTLYVKSATYSYHIRSIFQMARSMAPCMLVLEDIDTIVTSSTRSYFFNEVDGLENNDGILMVATTNHLDQLDPGLSKRPSRFDRKYLFPLPNAEERSLYAHYWFNKLKNKDSIDFAEELCDPIADITEDFSFAYMKEAFVATLLELARGGDSDSDSDQDQEEGYYDDASDAEYSVSTSGKIYHEYEDEGQDNDDDEDEEEDEDLLDEYRFGRAFKAQVKILRREMSDENSERKTRDSFGRYMSYIPPPPPPPPPCGGMPPPPPPVVSKGTIPALSKAGSTLPFVPSDIPALSKGQVPLPIEDMRCGS